MLPSFRKNTDFWKISRHRLMSVEHWRNDTDRRKSKYWQKNLSLRHFVPDKSHTDWFKIKTELPS